MITEFGLSPVSLAILALLEEPARQHSVHAWYNGRERGVCITVRQVTGATAVRHVVFAECRSYDSIAVSTWIVPYEPLNPPSANDRPESAWQEERIFDPDEITIAVEYVQRLIS